MSTIVVVGATTETAATVAAGGTVTAVYPPGTVPGDQLLLVVHHAGSQTAAGPGAADPAGWAVLAAGDLTQLYARDAGPETEVGVTFPAAPGRVVMTVLAVSAAAESGRTVDQDTTSDPVAVPFAPPPVTLVEDGLAVAVLSVRGYAQTTSISGFTDVTTDSHADPPAASSTFSVGYLDTGAGLVTPGDWAPDLEGSYAETFTVGISQLGLHVGPVVQTFALGTIHTPRPSGYAPVIPLDAPLPAEGLPPDPTEQPLPLPPWTRRGPGVPYRVD